MNDSLKSQQAQARQKFREQFTHPCPEVPGRRDITDWCGIDDLEHFLDTIVADVITTVKDEILSGIEEKSKTVTQMGFDPENRFKDDPKTEYHNRGRAYGFFEGIEACREVINSLSSPDRSSEE